MIDWSKPIYTVQHENPETARLVGEFEKGKLVEVTDLETSVKSLFLVNDKGESTALFEAHLGGNGPDFTNRTAPYVFERYQVIYKDGTVGGSFDSQTLAEKCRDHNRPLLAILKIKATLSVDGKLTHSNISVCE